MTMHISRIVPLFLLPDPQDSSEYEDYPEQSLQYRDKTSLTVDTSLDIVTGSCKNLVITRFDISASLNANADAITILILLLHLFNRSGKSISC